MRKKREDLMDEYPLVGFAYVVVALCVLGLVYTFFAQTELEQTPAQYALPAEIDEDYFENRD